MNLEVDQLENTKSCPIQYTFCWSISIQEINVNTNKMNQAIGITNKKIEPQFKQSEL